MELIKMRYSKLKIIGLVYIFLLGYALLCPQLIFGRRIRQPEILQSRLEKVEETFGSRIVQELLSLTLDNRAIGREILSWANMIRGVDPEEILSVILSIHQSALHSLEGERRIKEWQSIAEEIDFFLQVEEKIPDRSQRIPLEIIHGGVESKEGKPAALTSPNTGSPFLYTKGAGACMVLVFYDPDSYTGAMLHIVFDSNEYKYLIEDALKKLKTYGANHSNLEVRFFGASFLSFFVHPISPEASIFRLVLVYQLLREYGIRKIMERDILGESIHRNVIFDTRTNRTDF